MRRRIVLGQLSQSEADVPAVVGPARIDDVGDDPGGGGGPLDPVQGDSVGTEVAEGEPAAREGPTGDGDARIRGGEGRQGGAEAKHGGDAEAERQAGEGDG